MENLYSDEIVLLFSLKECKENCEYSIELKSKNDNSISFVTETRESESNNSIIKFSKTLLCNYYFYKIQNIEVNIKRTENSNRFFKYHLEPQYGLTLSTIVSSNNSSFQYPINKNNENSEKIMIVAEKSNKQNPNKYTLFDYLKAGISFDSYIVIDFNERFEHTHEFEINHYIKSIGGIRIALKDFLNTFKVYGYGANLKIPGKNNNNSSFFNLNLNGKEDLKGLTEIKEAYKQCIENLVYNNNNVLSPLIKNILRVIYDKYQLTKYNILFLLMNKAPKKEDYQKCIDALIETSLSPLSIVIIGIGDKEDEFKNIKNLYSNNRCHTTGMKIARNNIFFVSMKECKNNANELINIFLKQVPKQLVEFYSLINTTPNDIRNKNLKNIRQSMIKSINVLDPGSLCENIDSAPVCSNNIENKESENILESQFLIEKNYQKPTDKGNENYKIENIELEKIDKDNNIIEVEDIKNSFNPKKTIFKKHNKDDKENKIIYLDNRNELDKKKDDNDNETYTNTPINKNECGNKENPYVSTYINTPKGIKETKQNMKNPYDSKFINTPKEIEENKQNVKNPFKSSSNSDESTLNSIKKSSKDSILCNLNNSENRINPNNSIRDSQQYKLYGNYSIDDSLNKNKFN